MWKWKPDVEFQYGGRLGEFNGMSSQSHVSHCWVLPLGEFTVTIPEPHATLQGALCSHLMKLMWWSCHVNAECKNSIRHIENRFSPSFIYFFLFLMQFRLWQAVDFVLSPIHLLILHYHLTISSAKAANDAAISSLDRKLSTRLYVSRANSTINKMRFPAFRHNSILDYVCEESLDI